MQLNSNTSDDTNSPQISQFQLPWIDPIQFPPGNSFMDHPLPPTQSQLPSYQGLFDWGQLGYSEASECLVQYPISSAPLSLHSDLQRMRDRETTDAKALAASRNHSEAERRRRERINSHLAKLRSLLPTTTKTDKASLLAEVIHHVKELKSQTSQMPETTTSPFPTETDELTVDNYASDQDGKVIIKASICCDDRSDLLPDLIRALKSLKLRAVRAEIATVGGRLKSVLFITAEEEQQQSYTSENDVGDCGGQWWTRSIQEALKSVMEKSVGGVASSDSGSVKRQRTHTSIFSLQGPLIN